MIVGLDGILKQAETDRNAPCRWNLEASLEQVSQLRPSIVRAYQTCSSPSSRLVQLPSFLWCGFAEFRSLAIKYGVHKRARFFQLPL